MGLSRLYCAGRDDAAPDPRLAAAPVPNHHWLTCPPPAPSLAGQYNHVSHPVNDACDKCEKYFKEMWSKNGLAKFGTPSVLGPVYDPDIEDPNGPPEESEEEEDDEEEDDEYMVDAEGGWAQGTAGGATGAVGAAVQGGEAEGGAEGDAARKKSRSGKRKRKSEGEGAAGSSGGASGGNDDVGAKVGGGSGGGGGGGAVPRLPGGVRFHVKWRPYFTKALDAVMAQPEAEPFNTPVSTTEFPDYTKVVDKPVDLGTIRNRLSKHRHKDVPQALNDVARVWSNCRQYNKESEGIRAMCDRLEAEWERLWGEQLAEMEATGGVIPGLAKYRRIEKRRRQRQEEKEGKLKRRRAPAVELLAPAPIDPRDPNQVRRGTRFVAADWTPVPAPLPGAFAALARYAFAR